MTQTTPPPHPKRLMVKPGHAPSLQRHRNLENPGKAPLFIVEVQSGSYLGEDHIERFEDRYKRT